MDEPQDPPTPSKAPVWSRLHLWQMQPVRDILLGLAFVGLFWVGQAISVVTVPLLLAVLLAYLFEPVIVLAMRRLRFSRAGAVTVIIVMAIVFIVVPAAVALSVGVGQLVVFGSRTIDTIQTVDEAQNAESPEQVEEIFAAWADRYKKQRFSPAGRWVYEELTKSDDELAPYRDSLRAVVEWVDENRNEVATTAAGVGILIVNGLLVALGAVFGLGFMAFLTVFFFYFCATEWVRLKVFGRNLVPDKNREKTVDLLVKFDRAIAGFVRGRLTIAFLQAIVFSLGYFAIGVPGAFILGPIVAVLSIVPYLALVGLPISIVLLGLEGNSGVRGQWWWILGAPTAFYFICQALDDYVWTPLIQGKNTGMDTPTILFASLAGGALFGVFGLLIAIPIAACVKILVQEVFWPRFQDWADGRAEDPLPIEK